VHEHPCGIYRVFAGHLLGGQAQDARSFPIAYQDAGRGIMDDDPCQQALDSRPVFVFAFFQIFLNQEIPGYIAECQDDAGYRAVDILYRSVGLRYPVLGPVLRQQGGLTGRPGRFPVTHRHFDQARAREAGPGVNRLESFR
jgi:hypothetical protein